MPKTSSQVERDTLRRENEMLKATLRDTEFVLFDGVVLLGLRNLSMLSIAKDGKTLYPHKFACTEIIGNINKLKAGRKKRRG
jgi:hypothetical protein